MAFSTKLASICVNSSRSPEKRIVGLILASSRLPASSAAGAKASTHSGKNGAEVELAKTGAAGSGLDLGNAQQRIEGRQNFVDVNDRRLDRGGVLLDGLRLHLRCFEPLTQAGERRFQIVGDVGRDMSQTFHQFR